MLLLADAETARRQAAAILHQSRFHNPSVPRPLHSLLHDLGSGLQGLASALSDAVSALGSVLPGGAVTAWIFLAALVAGAATLVTRRYTRASLAPAARGRAGGRGRRRHDAAALEREADQAEREGRFADAVRLRFRAGLERLSEQGAIPPARATPTAELARSLHSRGFESLARRFDEIAYGSAPAAADDARAARAGWSDVLSGASKQ